MSRLQELHRAHEQRLHRKHFDWVFTYNEAPPDGRIVEVWIRENGLDRFGMCARFNHTDCVWLSPNGSFRDWNVVAWKDVS